MQRNKVALCLAVSLMLLPSTASSQQAPEAGVTLDLLLGEVRLLRRALERQVAFQARAQLLVGRLALQDQRVMRARSELTGADFML